MFLRYKWLSPDGDGTGADTSGAGAAQGSSGAGGQGTSDPAEIKKLHDEAASWRNKHKAAQEEAATLKQQLAELQGKLTTAETQTGVEKALIKAALKAKFVDPEDVLKFVDMAALMKLDADKRGAAINEALEKLAADKPHFVRSEAAQQGTDAKKPETPKTSPANPADNKPTLTMEQIKKMSREELAANKDEVYRVMKASGA